MSKIRAANFAWMFSLVISLAAFATAAPVSLRAQARAGIDKPTDSIVTRNGVCRVWSAPLGTAGFPDDVSYNTCAIDQKPTVISRGPLPYTTTPGTWMHAQFVVVIDPDGSVNSRLTRWKRSDAPPGFLEAIALALPQWRFRPGIRNGKPVRSALLMNLTTIGSGTGDPHRIDWRYRATEPEDTLTATWVVDSSKVELSAAQTENVYMALLKSLVTQRVMLPSPYGNVERQYCLVPPSNDPTQHTRLNARALATVSPPQNMAVIDNLYVPFQFGRLGCERSPEPKRIFLRTPLATAGGAVVLDASGDYLPNYPAGFNGQSWPSWKAHCIGQLADTTVSSFKCVVSPNLSRTEEIGALIKQQNEIEGRRRYPAGSDTLLVTAYVTTAASYQIDTLRPVATIVSSIPMHSVTDSLGQCPDWVAYSAQESNTLNVIFGNPLANEMDVIRVRRGSMPPVRDGQRCLEMMDTAFPRPVMRKMTAFFVGGFGDVVTAPVTVGSISNGRAIVLNPEQHTVASQPAFKFRLSDLRAESRVGGPLMLRVKSTGDQLSGVRLLVISALSGWHQAQLVNQVTAGVWDFSQGFTPPDTGYVYVYLVKP